LDLDPASAGLPADKDASEPGRAAERIAFTVDPAIIRSLIREQASTVEKAIAELVMNAVDAGADEIHIAVDQAGFTVRDNGRGFASRNEILTCFRRFGAPHVAGDATFGRFRIGRGQIMHWARCSWRSNTFEMTVDIQDPARGISFDLHEHDDIHAGCLVTGHFYRLHPQGPASAALSSVIGAAIEHPKRSPIAHLVAYVDAAVFLNGVRINIRPSEQRPDGKRRAWTRVDDLAYWRLDRHEETLRFYNLGVLVRTVPASEYGVGGLIITRMPLSLNMARNEIIQDEVSLTIESHLETVFAAHLKRHIEPTDAETACLIKMCLGDGLDGFAVSPARLSKLKIFKSPDGELHSYADVCRFSHVVLTPPGLDAIAERIYKSKEAFPLKLDLFPDLLDECDDDWEFAEETFYDDLWYQVANGLDPYDDFECPSGASFAYLAKATAITQNVISPDDLTPDEADGFNVACLINRELFGADRTLHPGASDAASAWTDGENYIAIERRLLGRAIDDLPAHAELILTLVHEYAHRGASLGAHTHDLAFYKRYHDMTLSPSLLVMLTSSIGGLTVAQAEAAGDLTLHFADDSDTTPAPTSSDS